MKVTACLAVSLDGKISPPTDGGFIRIGTDADIEHLRKLRDESEALVFGAATFRAYNKARFGHKDPKRPLTHCIITRTLDLHPDAELFQKPEIPTLIFSPTEPPEPLKAMYPSHIEWHTLDASRPAGSVVDVLKAKKLKQIQVEGGGNILPLFLNEKLLDSIHLTLCPLFIGQQPGVPSLINQQLNEMVKTTLLDCKVLKDEIYLHYQCHYK